MNKWLTLALAGIVGLIGFQWYEQAQQSVLPDPIPEWAEEESYLAETSDWTVYQDPETGVSFAHPKDWLGPIETFSLVGGAEGSIISIKTEDERRRYTLSMLPPREMESEVETILDSSWASEVRVLSINDALGVIYGSNGRCWQKTAHLFTEKAFWSLAGPCADRSEDFERLLSTIELPEN